jgi:hypothetical protein
MLILAILTFFFTAALLVILRLFKRRIVWHWLATLLGGMVGWILVLLTRLSVPHAYNLFAWQFPGIFSQTISLRLDELSWPYGLAIASLPLATVLTVLVRRSPLYWRSWAGNLLMTAIGLVAVFAGDALTMVFAWAAFGLLEVAVLFAQGRQVGLSRNAALSLGGRIVGIGMVILAMMAARQNGQNWDFQSISPLMAPYLLVAAGLQLGVLPLNAPFYFNEVNIRRGLGTALRLIPAASGLMLLTRVAVIGIPVTGWLTPNFPLQAFWLALMALSALMGSAAWVVSRNEMSSRLFWVLGCGALATAGAVLGQPEATLAWGMTAIFSGAIIFLHSARGRGLWLPLLISAVAFSGLSFTPGWNTIRLYQAGLPWLAGFWLAHALLLLGFMRHALRPGEPFDHSQRWAGALYLAGQGLLLASQFLVGYLMPRPAWGVAWWGGAVVVFIAAAVGALGLWITQRHWQMPAAWGTAVKNILGLNWLYRLIEILYHLVELFTRLVSRLLEGEGGLLWVFIVVGMLVTLYLSVGGVLGR